jgi:surfactin synthase thioesterase subunit
MTRWLVPWSAAPSARAVLLCLPSAGAGCGQFRPWQPALAPDLAVVGVQLPGRESRWSDPPASTVDEVIDAAVAELPEVWSPGCGLVVFGHSFGGLLGYEIARRVPADAVVVSACRPPHMWVGAGRGLVEDDVEMARLLGSRGLGPGDLDEDSRELMLDVLRQDARLSVSYRLRGDPALSCPVHAWGGTRDETVTSEQLDGWRGYAAGAFHRRQFPGDHYFHLALSDQILPALRDLTGVPADGRAQ